MSAMCFANLALSIEDGGFVNPSERDGRTRMKCSVKLGIVVFAPGKSSSSFIITLSATRDSSLFCFPSFGVILSLPSVLRNSGPMPGYIRGVSPPSDSQTSEPLEFFHTTGLPSEESSECRLYRNVA
jgi:hypothetical protein